MYVYIYDNFLRQKKYLSVIKAIEVNLTDFGIAGKVVRLSNYNDAKAMIDEEIHRGAKTVVMVGNDETFGQILSRAAGCECTFGFLPVGPDNSIADVLGIPLGAEGTTVLSRRRKQLLDVGWVNSRYFVGQLHVLPSHIEVIYDDRFRVTASDLMEVVVCNLQPFYWKRFQKDGAQQVVHPQAGKLEAFLRPLTKKGWLRYT